MGTTTALLLATFAAIVFVLDPFQVLRRSRGTPNLYGVVEYQVPGLARFYPYDAVVMGTSTSNNFTPEDLAAALGWQAMNFALAGSSIDEQRAALGVALRTGKPRHVLWGIDPFAFLPPARRAFPYYLYRDPGWRTAPYFVSLGAIAHGLATLVTPDAKRVTVARWQANRAWDSDYHYGRNEVIFAWEHRRTIGHMPLPDDAALARSSVEGIAETIGANPSVQFDLVLLPYTVYYYRMLSEERPREFASFCALDRAIVARAGALPNATVFNFRDDEAMTENLDRFHDLLHFSGEVSREIVREVAAGRRVVTAGTFEGVCGRVAGSGSRVAGRGSRGAITDSR
jgi:hypothetical protein